MSKVEETRESFFSSNIGKKIKRKFNMSYPKMTNMRIIQKKLVYVIGLSANLAFKDVNLKLKFINRFNLINMNISDSMEKYKNWW